MERENTENEVKVMNNETARTVWYNSGRHKQAVDDHPGLEDKLGFPGQGLTVQFEVTGHGPEFGFLIYHKGIEILNVPESGGPEFMQEVFDIGHKEGHEEGYAQGCSGGVGP